MRVLVTGGAGYIGSALVPQLLAAGHAVRVLDNLTFGGQGLLGVWPHRDFQFVHGDICNRECVDEAVSGCEAVVHLAAIVGDPACASRPELAVATNLNAVSALLTAAKARGISRFVFASTCSNYGKMENSDGYVDENSPLHPVSLYAKTKVLSEKILLHTRSDNICCTSLRLATVYGTSPRMRWDLTVNQFVREMVCTGKLDVFGQQFWRPYVHVVDVGRAIVKVLQSPPVTVLRQVFGVGATEENFRKRGIVEMIRPLTPGVRVDFIHRDEDPRDYRVSFRKINEKLGYTTVHTVAGGIRELHELTDKGVV